MARVGSTQISRRRGRCPSAAKSTAATRIGCVAAVLAIAIACDGKVGTRDDVGSLKEGGQQSSPATAQPDISVTERVNVPIPRRLIHKGIVVALGLRNVGNPETIVAVDAVVDEALETRFLGFTDCTSGCVGALYARPANVRNARRSVSHPLPAHLPRGQNDLLAVLVIRVRPGSQLDRCRRVRALEISLGSGRTVVSEFFQGGWIAALRPKGKSEC